MNTPPKAAESPAGHGLGIWWAILLLGAMTSLYLNIWHALAVPPIPEEAVAVARKAAGKAVQEVADGGGAGSVILAVTYGLVPVAFAALLSHGLVSPLVGPWPRRAIISLFLIGMAMSLSAQAAVMAPYGGPVGRWGIPIILDASALLALHVITKAAAAATVATRQADTEAELAALRVRLRPSIEAEVRAELEAELAAVRTDLEAELAARQAELEAELRRNRQAELAAVQAEVGAELGAELTARQAELEEQFTARLAEAEAEIGQRAETEIQARVRSAEIETEARVRLELARESKPKPKAKSPELPAKKTTDDGLTRKDKARILLARNPDLTGADLGRALEVSERYGRQLLEQLAEETQKEPVETSTADVRLRAVN